MDDQASSHVVGGQDVSCCTTRAATPVCIVVGMAGSGKTTLVNALACFLDGDATDGADGDGSAETPALLQIERELNSAVHSKRSVLKENDQKEEICAQGLSKVDNPLTVEEPAGQPSGAYVLNLDPAVSELPYEPNLDIRDTVKYKEVMQEYCLGPNGAIITSLNLFATRFDQVLALVEKRAPESRAVIVDTPGQIETFTWSASGTIITESLAQTLPTVILFVVDTPRSQGAMTFVSNMLYACSIMYKTRLPMVIVFNKIDVTSSAFAESWLRDFDLFDAALREENFAGTLARSMAQALQEFYSVMKCVSVSAVTEEGFPSLVDAIHEAVQEFELEYRPIVEQKKSKRAEEEKLRKLRQLEKLHADLESDRSDSRFSGRDTMWAPGEMSAETTLPGSMRSSKQGVGGKSNGMHNLNSLTRSALVEPPNGCDDTDEAQAYADFVKYLEALEISPSSNTAHGGDK